MEPRGKPGGPATVTLSVNGMQLGQTWLPTSMLMAAGNGETLDVGRDLGVPVTDYRTVQGVSRATFRTSASSSTSALPMLHMTGEMLP